MGGDGNDDLAWKADEKEDVVVMHITRTHITTCNTNYDDVIHGINVHTLTFALHLHLHDWAVTYSRTSLRTISVTLRTTISSNISKIKLFSFL